jgi:uncharacterized low-complexity protein
MSTKRSNLKSAALLTGAIFAGTASVAIANKNNADLLNYSSLGSGSELRSELLDLNKSPFNVNKAVESTSTVKFSELKCGEGKCGEGKCGEGESDKEKKAEKKEDKKEATSESKTDESSCGASEDTKETKESKKEDKE